MKAWIVTVGEPLPTDDGRPRLLRSGALARHLVRSGHEVTWFNSRFDHTHKRLRSDEPPVFEHDGVTIRLLDAIGYARNVSVRRVRDQRVAARSFGRIASGLEKPDVILCSLPTLELCAAVSTYCRANDLPWLVDIRDLWPDVYYRAAPEILRPLVKVVLSGQERLANTVLEQATGIVGISPNYLQWGLDRAGRGVGPNDHMIPLGYEFSDLTQQEMAEGEDAVQRWTLPPGRPIVWYVGTFGRQYDLAPVIRAARSLEREPEAPVFVISGVGDLEQHWRTMAAGLKNVVFTGWITRPELGWLRRNAKIGVQPYATGAPQGLANKTFEYLSAGLPMVSSLDGENRQLLAEVDAGLFYRNDDDSCLAAIRLLLNDESRRSIMARNARATYLDRFSSAAIFGGLETALAQVARSEPPTP